MDHPKMDGACIRCGQISTLAPLADFRFTIEAGAHERNFHYPHAAGSLSVGICEACTWVIAGSWPSAVGMCAAIRQIERRAGRDRRQSGLAFGRRATDPVPGLTQVDPSKPRDVEQAWRVSPAGESKLAR